MQKEDLFNYVMNSPQNTNPAVLKSIIEAVYAGNTPAGGPAGNIVNITNNTSGTIQMEGSTLITPNGVSSGGGNLFIPSGISNLSVFCAYDARGGGYYNSITVLSPTDIYTITVNETPITFDNSKYNYRFTTALADTPITEQTYNVVINNKE